MFSPKSYIHWLIFAATEDTLEVKYFQLSKMTKNKLAREPMGIVDSMEMKYECELTKVGKLFHSLCLVCPIQEKGGDTAALLLLHHGVHQAPPQHLLLLLQHHLVLHHHCTWLLPAWQDDGRLHVQQLLSRLLRFLSSATVP